MNQRSFYHLTRTDRDKIAEGIAADVALKDIAALIGKDPTAVSREVKRYRSYEGLSKPHTNAICAKFTDCTLHNLCSARCEKKRCATCASHACKKYCDEYEQKTCKRLSRWPHVCNGCPPPAQRRCPLIRYKYYPSIADAKAIKERSESRKGIVLDASELIALDRQIAPLLRINKMSVEAAWKACLKEGNPLPVAPSTLRRYIDQSRSDLIRLDLLSAPSRKVRKRRVKRVSRHADDGRSFADFEKLAQEDKDATWEMDTVQGSKRDACRLLTLCHRDTNFLFIFKIEHGSSECVTGILDYLEEVCYDAGIDFATVFPILLTDNGSEMSDTSGMEMTSRDEGDGARCLLYYCDPYSSWQKPHVECAHTLIRRVLPKGVSFESLTHADVALLCSHINSYPRAGDATPFEQIGVTVPKKMLDELGIKEIRATEVMLRPELLDTL